MSQLTKDQVRHIAKLCRLTLSEDEVEKFSKDLTAILDYIDRMQEVDTDSVKPLKSVTGLGNIFRDDTIAEGGPTPEELLECSPLPITDKQIDTPSAHG